LAAVVAIVAVLAAGGSHKSDDYAAKSQAVAAIEFEPEPEPEPPPEPEPEPEPEPPILPDLPILPPHFMVVEGIILDFEGPVNADGTVPWYVDWFTIEIEQADGTPATIVGVHQTAFLFGTKPTVGMAVRAYITADAPTFTMENNPIYIASAIVGDMDNVVVCWFREGEGVNRGIYTNADNTFHFTYNEHTSIAYTFWNMSSSMNQRPLAVVYEAKSSNIAEATSIIFLGQDFPDGFLWHPLHGVEIPHNINLTFFDYIFSLTDFTLSHLQFVSSGEQISAPVILADDGVTLMLPLRPFGANMSGLTTDGELNVNIDDAGSGSSFWQVGRPEVRRMGYRGSLGIPPIIVGGVVYVEAEIAIWHGLHTGRWFFDDRIEVFSSIYGSWLDYILQEGDEPTEEEVASWDIIINGVKMDAHPIKSTSTGQFDIFVPLDTMKQHFDLPPVLIEGIRENQWNIHKVVDDELYTTLSNFWGMVNFIIYNGQILIEDRW